ncbi:hypothetical protein WJX72_000416 [[Myrmecia] bisecta]|uniref:Protein VACUOLELESS1 n=1 Tax=[Myrmecia] bisecta TaxID=41462 RepID=A0AAW1Q4V4_9CHLO
MGSTVSPAGSWDACGDRFYSKHELYKMAWTGVELASMRVSCAGYGGPIAMVRDDTKIVLVTGGSTRPVVKTFSCAGALLGAFVWDGGRIAGLGWTLEEDLMLLEDTGQVFIYNMHGQKQPRQFSLGKEVQQDGILECCLWGDGLVVLTTGFALWAVTNLEEPRPQKLASPALMQRPHCMAVIEPRHTLSGHVEVLLATETSIIVVDADAANEHAVASSPVLRMAVAPDGQFVALFTADGRLLVWVSDLTKNLSEFTTQSEGPPDQLAWCGTDCVVMCWEDFMLMVGPYGDFNDYSIDSHAVLVPEIDGVRIVSNETHELLRRVPDCLVDVFRPGSTEPGALLFHARELFDAHNAKADEVLRSIAGSLPEGVATCVDAAGADFDSGRQTALMKAACYGVAFCPAGSLPPRRTLDMCRMLRVLNALRQPSVGMPLTLPQLEALTLEVLVARLVNARRHLLALRIASMIGMGPEKVLAHWACAKISAAAEIPDDALRDLLAEKLAGCSAIRYALIAAHAQAVGRVGLAAMLLEFESRAAEQVPLLLSLGEEERALAKALACGDTDLAYLVLFALYRKRPLPDFLATIQAKPLARSLFVAYCSRKEPELLEQIYMAMGVPEGVAQMRMRQAIVRSTSASHSRSGGRAEQVTAVGLAEMTKPLEQAADLYGQTKDHTFQSKAAAEFARLRRCQGELEAETGHACFVGLSLAATLRQCLRLGNQRAAARVRNEFRVSDKRFCWIKMRTMATSKDWDAMEAFVKEKKPSIGYEPFIAACKANGAPATVTARIIARISDSKRKAEEYAAIGMYQEAAETAALSRDSELLSRIQNMVGTASPLGVAVTQIKDRLSQTTR